MTEGVAASEEELEAWIHEVTGARVVSMERRSAGASRAGYAVDVEHDDGTGTELWLRADTGVGPQSHGVYTVRREAAVYQALQGRGISIAEVVAVHPTAEAFLMRREVGDTWFSQIHDPRRQERIAIDFMEQLAALHRIDVHDLDLAELGPVRSLREHVLDEIDIWDAQYRTQHDDEPLLELALGWLRRNLPPDDGQHVVLVQGDTGPGNFMYLDDHVVVITDWEMAHYGDRHDDLAWVYVRDLQERFTDLRERLRDYERFAGCAIDPQRLRYFLVLAQTRCAIGSRNGFLARDSRGEIANHLIYSTLHERLLAEALAEAVGVSPTPDEPAAATDDTDVTWMFDVALADLRDNVLPGISDGFAQRRAKGIARLLKYLREHDRQGALAAQRDLSDLRQLLGAPVDDLATARRELCRRIASGDVDDRAVLAHCVRAQARRTEVARPAMGALADRHYAPLPD